MNLVYCPRDMQRHFDDVLSGREYELPIEIEPPPVVLDLGANAGAYSLYAERCWPGCTIYAFEPHPKTAKFYRMNTKRMGERVKFSEVAVVGPEAAYGKMFLRYGRTNCGQSSLKIIGEQKDDGVWVQTLVASELPQCDVAKLDTEGCELEIIECMRETGKLPRRGICYEWHNANDRVIIAGILKEAGFKLLGDKQTSKNRGVARWTR